MANKDEAKQINRAAVLIKRRATSQTHLCDRSARAERAPRGIALDGGCIAPSGERSAAHPPGRHPHGHAAAGLGTALPGADTSLVAGANRCPARPGPSPGGRYARSGRRRERHGGGGGGAAVRGGRAERNGTGARSHRVPCPFPSISESLCLRTVPFPHKLSSSPIPLVPISPLPFPVRSSMTPYTSSPFPVPPIPHLSPSTSARSKSHYSHLNCSPFPLQPHCFPSLFLIHPTPFPIPFIHPFPHSSLHIPITLVLITFCPPYPPSSSSEELALPFTVPLHLPSRLFTLRLPARHGARGYRAALCTQLAQPLLVQDLPAPRLQPCQVRGDHWASKGRWVLVAGL